MNQKRHYQTQPTGQPRLKAWLCTDHDSYSPLGAASVVVAATAEAARPLLIEALRQRGLKDSDAFTLREIDLGQPQAVVLIDGNF